MLPSLASIRDEKAPPTRKSTADLVVCQSSDAAFHWLMSSGELHARQTSWTGAPTWVSTVILVGLMARFLSFGRSFRVQQPPNRIEGDVERHAVLLLLHHREAPAVGNGRSDVEIVFLEAELVAGYVALEWLGCGRSFVKASRGRRSQDVIAARPPLRCDLGHDQHRVTSIASGKADVACPNPDKLSQCRRYFSVGTLDPEFRHGHQLVPRRDRAHAPH